MPNCDVCDAYVQRRRRIIPTTDLHQLDRFMMVCKECDEFCKDYKRLFHKLPFKNCNEYEKSAKLAELEKKRHKSRMIKNALAALPYMSQEKRGKTMERLFPKAPSK